MNLLALINKRVLGYIRRFLRSNEVKKASSQFSPDYGFLVYFIGLSFVLLAIFGSFGLFNATFWIRIKLSLAYSLVSFLVFGITLSLHIWSNKKWKSIYWFFWLIIGTCIASPINLFIHDLIFGEDSWTLKRLLDISYYLLLLFLVSVISYFFIFRSSKTYSFTVADKQKLEVIADNPKNSLVLPFDNFLFAKSAGNYVEVHYEYQNRLHKKLIRSTMKRLGEQSSSHKNLIQCHQAFIVNLEKVSKLNGNAQNRSLTLKGYSESIPVSRRFSSEIKKAFNELSLKIA